MAGWDAVERAIRNKDREFIKEKVRAAVRGGARALNVSGAIRDGDELESLEWLLSTVCAETGLPLSLDSSDPGILARAADLYLEKSGRSAPPDAAGSGVPWLIFNSITAGKDKYDSLLPLAHEYRASVIALPLDGGAMPVDAERRVSIAGELVDRLKRDGIDENRIFVDPLLMPVAVDAGGAAAVLDTVRRIRGRFGGIRITCGLSNVSHGLPARKLLNSTFLAMLAAAGLDSAILDTTDRILMGTIAAAQALKGDDTFCAEYIAAYRSGRLDF